MDASDNRSWLTGAMLVGVIYLVAGVVFGALAGAATSHQMVVTWRAAAYVVSAVAFAAHIWYEHFSLHSSPLTTALHATAAVALGAFGLAAAANIHELSSGAPYRRRLGLALVAWPFLTAVPAFVVAIAATAVLARARERV